VAARDWAKIGDAHEGMGARTIAGGTFALQEWGGEAVC
jgi:hypothetical protein